MNAKIRHELTRRKRRLARRLDKDDLQGAEQPMLTAHNVHYEIAERQRGTSCGGLPAIHELARQLGLVEALDEGLHLLKIHRPYHESDHVLNLAYNALCGGRCLDDLEQRRCDEAYLDGLGARRTPDPTTAGDFCRRFTAEQVQTLQDIFHLARRKVWAMQPPEFFAQATIDMDGTIVPTTGECKQGIDLTYNGLWGYHALVLSLAETGEVLSIVNRPGNRPSHEGAAQEVDRALAVCLEAGFRSILLRGDTDFTQSRELDRWDAQGRIHFLFGADATASKQLQADDLPRSAWKTLIRPPRYQVRSHRRARPERFRERIVIEREFENIHLESEEVAETRYRPSHCQRAYRLIVVRKNLLITQGQRHLLDDYRYFFYLTNDERTPAAELVLKANDRCQQENLLAQLKGGVRALSAPVDNLVSNWAYMVMTGLAWNLKAWWALSLPTSGRWSVEHQEEKQRLLRMEFRTFIEAVVRVPAVVVRTGRRLVVRLLSYNRSLPTLFRFVEHLRQLGRQTHHLRC